ncbi:hypothetical protein RclHR1_05700012 [Rhizophagus clarus]|uniref:SAM domain-containing protein n=1 Tax=Rhizophagus clarus TaxID=94130 RepID=A0A2Z6SG51_9GLOM|nr:hypothetical protein RclHR1_05700012 [Rhizophagus clarus]GES78793.1 hypothetical protein GLOIN_2v1783898 [Rhizophagus clarus]
MSETSSLGYEWFITLDEIKNYNTEELINFLHTEENLKLDNDDFEIIRKEKFIGRDLFGLSQEEFDHCGMAYGPAKRLLGFFKEIEEKKSRSRSFLSSETLTSNDKYIFSETVSEHLQKFLSEKLASINQCDDKNESYLIYKDLNWWTSPAVKVGIINKISKPYNKPAEGLVKMGKKCLEFIKNENNFQVSYRVELRPINDHKWEYIMQLDSVTWFDMLHKVTNDFQLTLEIARIYVNSIRSECKMLENVQSDKSSILSKVYCWHHADCIYPPTPTDETPTDKTNNKNKNVCTSKTVGNYKYNPKRVRSSKVHNPNYETPSIFCAGLAPQQTRPTRYCNWYVEKERIVLEEDEWICVSHQDDIRDILICANPMYCMVNKPDNHKTNKDLVVDGKFWEWVLGYFISSYLENIIHEPPISNPIELLALNFGKWESTEAKDSQAKECHGHLHVHIKPEVVKAFENAKNTAMYGKIGRPKQYNIQNCIELETHRLLSLEMGQGIKKINEMNQKINKIDQKINVIDQKVNTILSEIKNIAIK